jgi:cell division protein FtsQ
MARSLADRSPIGRLTRPFGLAAAPWASGRSAARGGAAPAGVGLLAPVGRAGRSAARLLASLAEPRRARLALLVVLAVLPVLIGGWLWLRNSSFVAVRSVQVTGVHGPEAGAIESALADAAHRMSTLDVNSAGLRAAVAPFRVVSDIRVSPRFPHGLSIRVVEQLPVAALSAGGTRTAVAADGVVLGPALLSGQLPTIQAPSAPAAGQRVGGQTLLAALAVLGAAPAPLAAKAQSVASGPRGLTVTMRGGLLVFFGDATRPHAKWLSLARVLADPSSAGASYVDVRLPSRPAAGFPAGSGPPSSSAAGSSSEAEHGGGPESTVAALAAGLAAGGGAGTSTAGTESPSAPGGAAGAASGTEAPSPGSPEASTTTTPSEHGAAASSEAPSEGATPGG